MARQPNYRFERKERERVQAEKRAAREALKEQRKQEEPAEGASEQVEPPAEQVEPPAEQPAAAAPPAAKAPVPAASAPPVAPQEGTASAAMKPIDTMGPDEIATLHANALRLASTGNARQRAAAQELLPRLEAALARIADAKKAAAAARLSGRGQRGKKD